MTILDEERIISHLRELREALSDWERYQSIPYEELESNRDTRNMVFHALFISIQSMIDIANHLIAEETTRRPGTYRESFAILTDIGLFTSDLGDELGDLAGFRNVLVHIYAHLNLKEVYTILQDDLRTVWAFEKVVQNHLKKDQLNG
jgi:uncharacterized protein YutE (UPF0331/DUF86 family)